MQQQIRHDVSGMRAGATLLQELKIEAVIQDDVDLSVMRSDLVAAAAEMFADRWKDARLTFTLLSGGLASGVNDTVDDFIAAEQGRMDSLTVSIDALDAG